MRLNAEYRFSRYHLAAFSMSQDFVTKNQLPRFPMDGKLFPDVHFYFVISFIFSFTPNSRQIISAYHIMIKMQLHTFGRVKSIGVLYYRI